MTAQNIDRSSYVVRIYYTNAMYHNEPSRTYWYGVFRTSDNRRVASGFANAHDAQRCADRWNAGGFYRSKTNTRITPHV